MFGRFESALASDDKYSSSDALTQLPEELAAALHAISAVMAPAVPSSPQSQVPPTRQVLDLQRVQALGMTLEQSLKRGALDDAVLAQLTASLTGHVAASDLDELQRAIDNFDFIQAQSRLAALLAAPGQLLEQKSA